MLTRTYPFLDPSNITVHMSSRLQALAEDCAQLKNGTAFVADRLLTAPLLDMYVPVISALGLRLVGEVIDHPLLGSRTIITSQVWVADPGDKWVRTLSRFYRLGRRNTTVTYQIADPSMTGVGEDEWPEIMH